MSNQLVILGLGSNLNALENLRTALLELRREFNVIKVSRLYESEAQLPNGAPQSWNKNYLNAAVAIEVENFDPLQLLKKIKDIEKNSGRVVAEKWAPRVIDIDILYIPDFQFNSPELTIPHPMLFSRPFAWRPAQEVFPTLPPMTAGQSYDTQVSDRYFWPEWAGIINVTPDSFSDGGKFTTPENFLKQAQQHLDNGADYIDIGAESTRPQATPITSEQEIERLKPYLDRLKCKISLDSRHFETIRWAVDNYSIAMINDVSGLQDRRLIELIQKNNLKAVCMHSLTVPADKTVTLKNEDPMPDIIRWWQSKEEIWSQVEVYFDPGFGFGKTAAQSWQIFNRIHELKSIRQKFFLGYSRKSFLGESTTEQASQKVNLAFAQILRVHDIASQKKALRGL